MKYFLIVVILSLLTLQVEAQEKITAKNAKDKDFEAFIEQLLTEINFNGSISFRNENRAFIHKNFGFTTAEKSKLIDDESSFNIGSISKSICAYALFSLILEEKIKFSDPISKYLTDLPDWSQNVTVEELMFYTTGLLPRRVRTDYTDENLWSEINQFEKLESKIYIYSNYNNFLQAKLVESISGKSLNEYVHMYFFKTLDMKDTRYTKYPTNEIDTNLTRSYSDEDGDDIKYNSRVLNFDLNFAPVYMTLSDLNKWMDFIVDKYDSTSLLHAIFYQETKTNESGPLGQIYLEEGEISKLEIAGSSYNSIVRGYYRASDSSYLILASNKAESGQLQDIKEQIYHKLGID